jgi:hypothetical protein
MAGRWLHDRIAEPCTLFVRLGARTAACKVGPVWQVQSVRRRDEERVLIGELELSFSHLHEPGSPPPLRDTPYVCSELSIAFLPFKSAFLHIASKPAAPHCTASRVLAQSHTAPPRHSPLPQPTVKPPVLHSQASADAMHRTHAAAPRRSAPR